MDFENQQYQRPRPDNLIIPVVQNNDDISSYAQCQYELGNICGFFRTWAPCVFCCCIPYPWYEIDQGNQGMFKRFGRHVEVVKPGLHYVNVCTDTIESVDMRTTTIDLDKQVIMTRDNVTIIIDTSVYFRIVNPRYAIYRVFSIQQAVIQVTYSILKNIVGSFLFQELLTKRAEIVVQIEQQVEKYVEDWGVKISHIFIKDIQLSQELQVALSSAATEMRNAQAKLITAKADVESAKLMRQSSEYLDSRVAMQVRYLETLNTLGCQGSSKVVFIPESLDKTKIQHYITQGLLV